MSTRYRSITAAQVAAAAGLGLLTVLMMLVNGFTTVFFPYQGAPILIGLRLGGLGMAEATRVMLILSTLAILTLLPLNFLWWRWLGYLN